MSSSDPFDLTDFPWPCNDDDLFDTSGPWTGHAVLDWQRNAVSGRMDGYRRAAEVLVEHVLKHRGDLDYLIFPIANCSATPCRTPAQEPAHGTAPVP